MAMAQRLDCYSTVYMAKLTSMFCFSKLLGHCQSISTMSFNRIGVYVKGTKEDTELTYLLIKATFNDVVMWPKECAGGLQMEGGGFSNRATTKAFTITNCVPGRVIFVSRVSSHN